MASGYLWVTNPRFMASGLQIPMNGNPDERMNGGDELTEFRIKSCLFQKNALFLHSELTKRAINE